MSAKEIVDVLKENDVDTVEMLKMVFGKVLDKIDNECDVDSIVERLLYIAEAQGKIPEFADEILDIVFKDGTLETGLDLAIAFLSTMFDIKKLIEEWLSEQEDGDSIIPQPPDPPPINVSTVRVQGNKIIGVDGTPLFLKIGLWCNFFEHDQHGRPTIDKQQLIQFMSYCHDVRLNCILFKANMWIVKDDGRTFYQDRINTLNWLIGEADKRGIYIILNMFDVWSRGKGGRQLNTDSNRHPINVWNEGHTGLAVDYVKRFTNEFKEWPRVLFEIGNEMAHVGSGHGENYKVFRSMARHYLLPAFYDIAGQDRPIGCSESQLWDLPINVVFNHNPNYGGTVGPSDRPIVSNELAHGSGMWKDSCIRNGANSEKYLRAFARSYDAGESGCCAASGLKIQKGYNSGPVNYVLTELGKR